MIRLLPLLTAITGYLVGRFVERAWWMADEDTYRKALVRRLLDSDVHIQMMEV